MSSFVYESFQQLMEESMQNPFEITGPGEFVTRRGELAVVLGIVGDQAFGYVEAADGCRLSEDWYADTGKAYIDIDAYEDIVGVWTPPARVKMYMYKIPGGAIRGFDHMCYYAGWKLISKGELVEGEGLDAE